MNDVVRGPGPLGDHQWLIQTIAPNRILDPVVFRIDAMPRVAFVGLDTGDIDDQG